MAFIQKVCREGGLLMVCPMDFVNGFCPMDFIKWFVLWLLSNGLSYGFY